jgi:tetratricopeptide (TPR) repeat protein
VVVAANCILGAGPAGAAQATQPASTPASAPATQAATWPPVVLPLSRVPRRPVGRYTLKQMEEMFPAFQHEPFETAGFNHLTLPFHYEDRSGGSGDANEAHAFAFLISSALDWSQGCYCVRHAYFVFKRSKESMQALAKEYDAEKVRSSVRYWQATHAVGGKIVRQKEKDRYSGSLVIYDRMGRPALEVDYDKPRDFFDLLGDMSVDALKAMAPAPSPELVKHLHVRQCNDRQSLIDLGKAAFMEERSQEEFALYDAVLQRDPAFATVRCWRANQKCFTDRDYGAKALEYGKSLDSLLVPLALKDFPSGGRPDATVVSRYSGWIDQAKQLMGGPQPWMMTRDLTAAQGKGQLTSELLDQATGLAARYPNEFPYLWSLSRAYSSFDGVGDCDTAGSILLAALGDRYMTVPVDRTQAVVSLAWVANLLGRSDLSAQLLLPGAAANVKGKADPRVFYVEARMLGEAMFDLGRFDESMEWYRLAFQGAPAGSHDSIDSLVGGAVSAAHAGRADVVGQILRDRRAMLDKAYAAGLLEGYLDLMAGKKLNYKAAWCRPGNDIQWWLDERLQTLTMQADILEGQAGHWKWADDNGRTFPYRHENKVLLHEFFQKHPNLATDCFYRALEWTDPDDAWAKQAVAAYRSGGSKGEVIPPDKLLAALKDYPPVRRPMPSPPSNNEAAWDLHKTFRAGAITAAVRDLLAAGKIDRAEELALRYLSLCAASHEHCLRPYAYHLAHCVEQARKAMKATVGPNDL